MNWVNLTPHVVEVQCANGNVRAFPPTGVVARVHSTDTKMTTIDNIVISRQISTVVNLPAPMKGVAFIVSRMVARELPDRKDLVVPGNKIPHPATNQKQRVDGFQILL